MEGKPAPDWTAELGIAQNIAQTLEVFRLWTPDRWHGVMIQIFENKLLEDRTFWEFCCALNLFSRRTLPARYLEIGVRRGKSMAQVVCTNPTCDIVGFDAWVTPYAEVENPGPEFVASEMLRLGHRGKLELISGDTEETLPRFMRDDPGAMFDLATVDGDHSEEIAFADLRHVAPRIREGGLLVMDDLTNPNCPLAGVWTQFKEDFSAGFTFRQNLEDHSGTGLAIRKPL